MNSLLEQYFFLKISKTWIPHLGNDKNSNIAAAFEPSSPANNCGTSLIAQKMWTGEDSNLCRASARRFYRPVPLTARPPVQKSYFMMKKQFKFAASLGIAKSLIATLVQPELIIPSILSTASFKSEFARCP